MFSQLSTIQPDNTLFTWSQDTCSVLFDSRSVGDLYLFTLPLPIGSGIVDRGHDVLRVFQLRLGKTSKYLLDVVPK